MSHTPLPQTALDQLFLEAHTHNAWQDKPVPDALLHRLYELLRMAPTSANNSPARIVFVRSKSAKEKLLPALMEGNRAKTMAAPVTALIGYDLHFYDQLGKLFPNAPDAAPTPSVTARCKAAISYLPRAHWDWIAARCPASTTRRWMNCSLRERT